MNGRVFPDCFERSWDASSRFLILSYMALDNQPGLRVRNG